jgi:hypothetical protein
MSNQLIEIAYRRQRLVQRIGEQRADMLVLAQQWHKPLALADSGVKAFHVMRNHPAWVAGGLTALLAWRLKGIMGLAKSGWRLAYLYPSAVFAGYQYLSALTSPKDVASDEADDDLENR